jgi:hypothetical protein
MVCTVPVVSSETDLSTRSEADARDERRRIEKVNDWRAARRGYLVFATDPDHVPGEPGYRDVYATEARTRNEAIAKVRAFAGDRRLRVFLATGRYRAELPSARWIP